MPLILAALVSLAAAASEARADSLILTEVVTDPQQDHSESADGNGSPFDSVPGDGTVSTTDEFVEIFNQGLLALDLRGFTLWFLDSSPESYVFGTSTSGVLLFSPGSSLIALLPGGFLVLGNPPGSMNNRIDLVLEDASRALVDSMAILDGKAQGPGDEATGRRWDGAMFLAELLRGAISPLAPLPPGEPPQDCGTEGAGAGGGAPPPAPVPEPGSLALTLLALLLGARPIAQRARRGSLRRLGEAPR